MFLSEVRTVELFRYPFFTMAAENLRVTYVAHVEHVHGLRGMHV